jgi:polyphosphate kinase
LERIRREVTNQKAGKPSGIIWKLNSLVDPEVIEELYIASQAGVKIDLIVRGICCLRPGVKKMSENISVISIVGRFLEHSRIYYFENAGKPDAYIGSADAMRRNLDRRVEVLVPVENRKLQQHIKTHILETCLNDNVQAWTLDANGKYTRRKAPKDKAHHSQNWFMARPTTKTQFSS